FLELARQLHDQILHPSGRGFLAGEKAVEKKGAAALGESCRQVPRAMGGCPRHKLTEASTQESKRKSGIFVPHLGDFLKAL
ncbi:MAG: hypothetical protein VW959_06655, partial [Aquiluna sp.]